MNNRLIKGKEEGNQTDKLFDLIEQLMSLAIGIVQKDQKRGRLRMDLFDDRNKSKVVPSFKAIEVIREISNQHETGKAEFFDLLQERFGEINGYDAQLGMLINKILEEKGLSPLISRLNAIFLRYQKERVFEHFKQYNQYYSEKLMKLVKKRIATKVLNVIKGFLEVHEKRQCQIDAVKNFANKVKNWDTVRGSIELYIEEARNCIEALRSLKDKKIDLLLDSHVVQRILVYQRELILLNDILRRVSSAVEEEKDTWNDFLNVYKNMKHIARVIEEKYFDKTTADELRVCMKDQFRYGEQPKPWIVKFNEIIYRLQKEGVTIRQTQLVLLDLFGKVISRIEEVNEMEFIQVRRNFAKIISEMKKLPTKYRMILLRIAKRREKDLNERLMIIRKRYDNLESYVSKIAKRFYELLDILKNIKTDSLVRNLSKIEAKKEPLYKRGFAIMNAARGDDLNSFKILSDNMLPLFVYENALYSRFNEIREKAKLEFYLQIPKLAFELRKVIPAFEKQLDNLISYSERLGLKDEKGGIKQEVRYNMAA